MQELMTNDLPHSRKTVERAEEDPGRERDGVKIC
jgi:hypothetical protein